MSTDMPTKRDLLRDLTSVGTADPPPRPRSGRTLAAGVAIAVVVVGVVAVSRLNSAATGSAAVHSDAPASDASERAPSRGAAAAVDNRTAEAGAATREPARAGSALDASGFITATRVATVSAKNFGLIKTVAIEEGDRVAAGQVLAQLDDTQAQMSLRLAEAQIMLAATRVRGAEGELAEAVRVLQRERGLQAREFSSDALISNLETQVQSRTAALASAKAEHGVALLQAAQQRMLLADYTIRAPFSGVVLVKNAQPGEIIAPSAAGGGYTRTGICTIVDMSSLEIAVDVNEEFISRVQPGQRVRAELYAYKGWTFPAEVSRVIPSADRSKATVRVRIRILATDARILPDMAVKVVFL